MKKRIIGAIIAAIVMALLFAACGDPQIVEQSKASTVDAVNVAQISSNYFVVVSWTATKDASGYNVFIQQQDKNTINSITGAQNSKIYRAPPSGSTLYQPYYIDIADNDDIDAWSTYISVQFTLGTGGSVYKSGTLPADTSYRFGVQTISPLPNKTNSDIKWSEYVRVVAPANLTWWDGPDLPPRLPPGV